MFEIAVQKILIAYVRCNAPDTHRAQIESLRDHYGRILLGIRDPRERRLIGQAYFQAKAALIIRLAGVASSLRR